MSDNLLLVIVLVIAASIAPPAADAAPATGRSGKQVVEATTSLPLRSPAWAAPPACGAMLAAIARTIANSSLSLKRSLLAPMVSILASDA